MKILLDGYFDHNLGDDLMLTLAAKGLKEHELYIPSDKISLENVTYTTAKTGFDAYLKVIGSGFQIYNTLGIAYRLRDMYRENRYAPVKAVIGCNITMGYGGARDRVILKQLKGYDFITVRDIESYLYIKENLPNASCENYPDIVFSLPDSMIPDTPCESFLGIALNKYIDSGVIAEAADGYIEETGNKALLLCFDTGEENDALAAENVLAKSKYRDKFEIVLYENIPDMLAQMKRCSVIFGIRFHSIVLAARMGIPFVPMASTLKTVFLAQDMGIDDKLWLWGDQPGKRITEDLLNAKPYNAETKIKESKNHIIKFSEYLKRRG